MADSLPVRVASFGGRRIFVPENISMHDSVGDNPNGLAPFQAFADPCHVNPFTSGGDILDHQVVILEYANGVCATFHVNLAAAMPERRFYLLGSRGALRTDMYDGNITFKANEHHAEDQEINTDFAGSHGGGDRQMTLDLIQTMLHDDQPPHAGIDDAMRSAVVAFAIDQAVATRTVVDMRNMWQREGITV